MAGAEDAAAAMRVAGAGRLLLLSEPGAAGFLGPVTWRALVARAARDAGTACLDALCCGAAAGDALAALRAGCRIIILDGATPAFATVAAAAAELGALLLPTRPPALDVSGLDWRRDGARRKLLSWLSAQPAGERPGIAPDDTGETLR